ncbi:MAG: ATP-binding protein, partial [Verrucomicrobiales bacterium]|nr:ATP-binding protein [Verrucomicrobiales bacterium]
MLNKENSPSLPASSEEIPLPDALIDQVIGQDQAVDIVRLAAKQRRFLLLVGEPGTGKSLLGQAVAQLLEDQPLQDTVSIDNPQEKLLPKIQVCPAGEGERLVNDAKNAQVQNQLSTRFITWFAAAAILLISLFYALKDEGSYGALAIGAVLLLVLYLFSQKQGQQHSDVIPKILVNHAQSNCAPFVDATGSQAGSLLGDVRHDPYQSGGSETPPHRLLEAGAIHRAHVGVLFIYEIST